MRRLVVFLVTLFVVAVSSLEGPDLEKAIKELPQNKVDKSHKKFKFFDVNEDGMINREEFEDGLKKLGYKTSEKKMAHILEELDANKDGNVEFHEFLRPTCKKHKEEAALEKGAGADKAFELLDGNVDGKVGVCSPFVRLSQVTAEEFHAAISKVKAAEGLTLEDIKGFIDQYADTDGDQELSYDEVETLEMTHT